MIDAIVNPIFQPAMRIISSISNSNPAIIVTTFAHQYYSKTIVRLLIPVEDEMVEADELFGEITVIDAVTFSIPINTTLFTPFVNNLPAQVVPIGENSDTLIAATQNILPF